MKRKLVDYEVFASMRDNYLTTSMKELVEAEDHLANVLNVENLKLVSFNDATVIYESSDGNYIRANYSISDDNVSLTDLEQIVIEEESQNKERRRIVAGMLESILEGQTAKAKDLFFEYMKMASLMYKRNSTLTNEEIVGEAYARLYGSPDRAKGGRPRISVRTGAKDPKRVAAALKAHRLHPDRYKAGGRKRSRNVSKERSRRKHYKNVHPRLRALNAGQRYADKKKMTEWSNLSNNVFGFLDYKENGYVLAESHVERNDHGIVAITLPTSKVRNEGKVIKLQLDTLKSDVKILRETAKRLIHDSRFCQAVADIKRYNNLSDNNELEESISNLVSEFPSILYLTEDELAHSINMALDYVGVTNYDDKICRFMAEGILRMAHNAYSERVDRLYKLANAGEITESDDRYVEFQKLVSSYFPTLDESTQLEFKMYEDLYNAVVDIRRLAMEANNEYVSKEAAGFINELEEVINGKEIPSLELASEVAEWLEDLVETNLETDDWQVVKAPHKTVSGDHPQMSKNARKPYAPASDFSGDWGDPAPAIDGEKKGYKGSGADDMRNHAWGNKGGNQVWPSLTNPYVPSPFGDYTMKGERGADKDTEGLGVWQDNRTWPNLQNPYVPQSVVPRQKVQPDNPVE